MSRATPAPVTPTQEKSGSFTGIGKLSHHLSLCFEVLFVVSYYQYIMHLTVSMSRATLEPATPTQENSGSFTGTVKLSSHLSFGLEVLFVISYYQYIMHLTVSMSRVTPAPATPTQEGSGSFTGTGKLSSHLSLCMYIQIYGLIYGLFIPQNEATRHINHFQIIYLLGVSTTWTAPVPGTLTLESSGHSLDQGMPGPGTLTLESSGHSLGQGSPSHIFTGNDFDVSVRFLYLYQVPSLHLYYLSYSKYLAFEVSPSLFANCCRPHLSLL